MDSKLEARSARDPADPHSTVAPQHEPRTEPSSAIAQAPLDSGFGWARSLWTGLGPFLTPHKKKLVIIGVLLCIELGLEAGQQKIMSYLIDEAILKSRFDLLVQILIGLFITAIVVGCAALTREWFYATLAAVVPGEVRTRIFEHVQMFPLQQVRAKNHGDLISRMTGDASSVEPAIWSIGYAAVAIGGMLFSILMLAWTEWRMTLAGLVLMPLAIIGPRILSPRAARESYASRKMYGALMTHLQENLANQVVLRVFGLGRYAQQRFAERNQQIIATSRRYNVYSYYTHRVPWIVIEMIQVLMLALGGWLVFRGELTPGGLVAFYLLFSALCNHIWAFTTCIPNLIEASAGMRRVHEVLDHPIPLSRVPDGARFSGLGEGIRFENLAFSYEGDQNQLEGVNLEIRRGEMVAFVGASGSGKSTALQLLLGVQLPNAGRVVVGGTDLREAPLGEYWSRTSAVFQDSLLFHASIGENIRTGRLDATDAEIEQAARAAEIHDWVKTLPEGYNTLVSADTCSGGQRQRLAIARALIRNPELLVLDEPASALDPATGAAIMQTLRKVADGRTVVLVTHHLRDASNAARIVVFEAGRIVQVGSHADLLARGGPYATLWVKQRDLAVDEPA